MSKKYYCQCTMEKKISEDTHKTHVAWLPEKFAKAGNYVKLKIDDVWEDGWLITYAGPKTDANIVEDKERDFLKQRKHSDR